MKDSFPRTEAQRLQILLDYGVVESPSGAAFERITRLAAQLVGVPIALISLADTERQEVQSSFGLDEQCVGQYLSFCTQALLGDEVLLVPDASVDSRFKDSAAVKGEPHIRFYGGFPLRSLDGQCLGVLCVMDTVPHQLSSALQGALADLADMVVDEIELRRVVHGLRESEATLRQSEAALRESEVALRESEIALRASLQKNSQLIMAVTHLPSGVIITDPNLHDNPLVFANEGFFKMTGYKFEDVVGRNCRFLQGPDSDPEIVAQIRAAVAERRPFQGVLINYRKDGSSFINELIINPVFDSDNQLLSFVSVQNDVTERECAKQLLEERVQERTLELSLSKLEILERLASAAELRDDDTGQHTQRVARIASLLAERLGWSYEQVALLAHAAILHDVGKIAISDLILLKPGKLTEQEFATMKTHTTIGANLLRNGRSEAIQMAERIAGSHHERFDGKGYPNHLAGEQIPIEGRILAVADVFDALTHERPYKHAWSVAEAVAEIERQSGQQFDPEVVEAFLTLPHETLV